MSFELTYFWFNLIEGVFWIVLGLVSAYMGRKYGTRALQRLSICTCVTLLLFGISDFVEIYTDGFIGHDTWLFVWKGICVAMLIMEVLWYVRLRKE